MKYEPISAVDDDFSSLKKKLEIYGYPYSCYAQLILNVIMQTVSMKLDKNKKKAQIDRLKRFKEGTEKKFQDIINDVFNSSVKSNSEEVKSCNYNFFGYNYFLRELDSLIRMLQKNYQPIPIVKRREQTVDYIIGAVLSLIIKDSRGTRWKDVYELLRWFNNIRKSRNYGNREYSGFYYLHTEHFTHRDLEAQSKYIKKKYNSYILELKKDCFKPKLKV